MAAEDAAFHRLAQILEAHQAGFGIDPSLSHLALLGVGAVLAVAIWIFLGKLSAIGFVIGAVLSGAAGYIGMNVSVRANVRTAEAARVGLNEALNVAFKGGAITGMLVVGLSLIHISEPTRPY